MRPQTIGTIREFKTANFRVIVDAIEDCDIDLSWEENGEVLAKLQSGEYLAFCARARVLHSELGEVASDYLGGCIYDSIEAFQDHRLCGRETRRLRESGSNAICGSYFSDMVREVCRNARKRLAEMRDGLNGLTIRA